MRDMRQPIPLPPAPVYFVFGVALTLALSGVLAPLIKRVIDHAPTTPPAQTSLDAAVEARATQIALEIEGVVSANRGEGLSHMLTAFFAGEGAMQVIFTIEPDQEWTGAFREEFADAISDALRRGAIQFQLIAIPGVPETVVSL